MNKSVAITIALVLLLAGGIVGYFTTKEQQGPMAGADPTLPDAAAPASAIEEQDGNDIVAFSLTDIDGQTREFSEWQGKGRLVNFWATWCAPCRREIPLLKSTQDAHGEDDNIQVIGIAVDFQEDVAAYAEEAQFNYPILVGQEDAMAAAEDSGIDFLGLPFTMIVAPSGELLTTHVGEIVENHIDLIVDVFRGLENGRLDLDGARAALDEL
ncbi:MAG: TlpA family protein disulfide reductase [Woeseiaceae bacterium]